MNEWESTYDVRDVVVTVGGEKLELGPGERYDAGMLSEVMKQRQPSDAEKQAAARYNAMNRHDRRAFDARARKFMREKRRRARI
jgi:uncharacterized protein YaiI (UPF0178 family)